MGRKTEELVFGAVARQILDSYSEVHGPWPGTEKPEFMMEILPVFWGKSLPFDVSKRLKIIIEGMKSDLIEGGLINILRTVAKDEDDPNIKWHNYFISYVPQEFLQSSIGIPNFLVFALLGFLPNIDNNIGTLRLHELLKSVVDEAAIKNVEVPNRSELEKSFMKHKPPHDVRFPDLLFLDNDEYL